MDRKSKGAEPRIGADVAGSFLSPDVLLARRQSQHPTAPAIGVDGLADEPPRHLADEFVAAREQAEMRSAKIERIAERLTLRSDNVSSHIAGGDDRTERQDLRHHDDQQSTGVVAGSREVGVVTNITKKPRVLDDDAGSVAVDEPGEVLTVRGRRIQRAELETDEPGIGFAHLAVMRMESPRYHHLSPPGQTIGHHHRLGAG